MQCCHFQTFFVLIQQMKVGFRCADCRFCYLWTESGSPFPVSLICQQAAIVDKVVPQTEAKLTVMWILVGRGMPSCQTCPWWVNVECCVHQSFRSARCFSIQHHMRWDVAVGKYIHFSCQWWERAALHNMFFAKTCHKLYFLAATQMLTHIYFILFIGFQRKSAGSCAAIQIKKSIKTAVLIVSIMSH